LITRPQLRPGFQATQSVPPTTGAIGSNDSRANHRDQPAVNYHPDSNTCPQQNEERVDSNVQPVHQPKTWFRNTVLRRGFPIGHPAGIRCVLRIAHNKIASLQQIAARMPLCHAIAGGVLRHCLRRSFSAGKAFIACLSDDRPIRRRSYCKQILY